MIKDSIKSLISNFEQGDALALAEIKEECQDIVNHYNNDVLYEVIHTLPDIVQSCAHIPLIQVQCIQVLEKIVDAIDKYSVTSEKEKKKLLKQIKSNMAKLQKLVEEQKNSEINAQDREEGKDTIQKGEKASFYSIEDFLHLVDDQKLLQQFYHEATEHLDSAQFVLLELEHDSTNSELINTVFRDFHTIKGSSSFLGIKNVEDISHAIEDIFAAIRDGKMLLTRELVDVIFYGMELLRSILDIMQSYEYNAGEIKKSFITLNVFPFIALLKKILQEYQYKKIGEILQEEGKLSPVQLNTILAKQQETDKKFGQIVTEERIVEQDDLLAALQKQQKLKSKIKKIGFVKVSNEKLNSLIDYVGELVINQSMLKQEIERNRGIVNISERTLSQAEMITSAIKDLVLSMGMVPIEEVFNKLRVVARNTAQELQKTVFIEVHGEETELDRNVIETIYDPLMHIIRNAIDHGIESSEERTAAGKDRVGRITLSAEHKGSGIEITIMDDGRGIDTKKILDKAIAMQLVKKEDVAKLTDKDIYNFMFLPGFSTSSNITAVSGRGVGLDVVKKGLEQIHGRVEIHSEPGKYTKFIIKLPLTLAIIEGFVTVVGNNRYVFPFNSVEEILVFNTSNLQKQENTNEAILYHRDMHIPVIFAHDIFKEKFIQRADDRLLSLIFTFDQFKYCVVVDSIIGKQEIVVKSLGTMLNDYQYFSGGTIFGDGSIGFVVDLQGFIEAVK
ncbi:MAG: chemotaxis protein CheA [Spirochaetota bacterium]|jgi:two-component system chemotaxis sensor kinase CheA